MRKNILSGMLGLLVLVFAFPVFADSGAVDAQSMMAALDSMKNQMADMQAMINRQNLRIQQLESKVVLEKPRPALPMEPSKEMPPPWLEGLKSKGDVRLRYETFSRENEDTQDRNRFRARVRWGLEKKLNDEWKAGFRLATGGGTDEATSTNQTLDGEFGLKDIFIDRAYGIYTPTERIRRTLPGVSRFEIGAGKVANPYKEWASTVIWDSDVNPEGIYQALDFKIKDVGDEGRWELHTLFAQFVVDEDSDLSPGDHELLAYGVGTTYAWKKNHNAAFKFTYYDWQDYADFLASGSALANAPGGNEIGVEEFKIVNFYAETNFSVPTWFGERNLKLFGDYAHNTDVGSGAGITPDSDDAFSVGVLLGKAKKKGSWQAGYEYYYIEPNAVVGNFAEGDLGVGFANNEGHKLSYKYRILDNLQLNATAWLAERVEKVAGDDDELLRTQLDLVYKF